MTTIKFTIEIPDKKTDDFTDSACKALQEKVKEYTLEIIQETNRIGTKTKEENDPEITKTHIIQATKSYRSCKRKNTKLKVFQIISSVFSFVAGIMFLPDFFLIKSNGETTLNILYLSSFLLVCFLALGCTILSHVLGDD